MRRLRLLQLAPESVAHSAQKMPFRPQGLQVYYSSAILEAPPASRVHILAQHYTVHCAARFIQNCKFRRPGARGLCRVRRFGTRPGVWGRCWRLGRIAHPRLHSFPPLRRALGRARGLCRHRRWRRRHAFASLKLGCAPGVILKQRVLAAVLLVVRLGEQEHKKLLVHWGGIAEYRLPPVGNMKYLFGCFRVHS